MTSERDQLINDHLPLVRRIANFVFRNLSLTNQTILRAEDLISAGVIGLLDSVEKFNSTTNEDFSRYAGFRIKGAILDELRRCDDFTRDLRNDSNKIAKAVKDVETQKGRKATEQDLAEALGLPLDKFRLLAARTKKPFYGSQQELEFVPCNKDTALEKLLKECTEKTLAMALEALPKQWAEVIDLYYFQNKRAAEVAKILKLSEDGFFYRHRRAIEELRKLIAAAE